jgi:DNA polymerase-3 subunit delta
MIIFLYGPDTYRSRQKLNEIIEHYKKIHKNGLSLIFLDLEEKNYKDFIENFQSLAMFKEKKLIVLKNASKNFDFKESFRKEIKKFANSKEIILFYEEEDLKDNFFEKIKKNSKWQNFQILEGEKLKLWVKKEIKRFGAEIEENALKRLIEFVDSDLWRMENEIKKLVSFSQEKKIKLKDIETLVSPEIETDIFKTIDAIGQKNKVLALKLVHKHLEKGDSPLYLLSMINYQLKNIILVKDLIERRRPLIEAGLYPFLLQKTIYQARKFSFQEIKKIYQKIFEMDLKIKSGQINPELALDLLVSGI